VFVAIVIAALVRLSTRRSSAAAAPPPASVKTGRRLMVTVAVSQIVFVIALVILVSDLNKVLAGPATGLKIALTLPVIGALVTVAAAWLALAQWRDGAATVGARLRHSAAVLVAIVFFWSLNTWNLLGWKM